MVKTSSEILGDGRTLITDSAFTSSECGRELFQNQKTKMVGTIRIDRKGLPANFNTNEKLKVKL